MIPLLLFLIMGTASDIKKRSIPAAMFLVFGMLGALDFMISGRTAPVNELLGIILGVVFIGISLISDNKLGMGDALAILVTGIFLGGAEASCTVLYAMLITAVFSIIILASGRGSRTTAMPFMPFLLAGYMLDRLGAMI
ncbi:MAG: prepilin peptidase [Lachnospiraceae bacterium]|nr:prepilin peptidase [Lachnospiraceae bacterium]